MSAGLTTAAVAGVYQSISGADSVATLSIAANEPPPPYTPTGHGCIPMINCKVCQAMINLQGRMNQHVVTCGACNEATAIRPAPAGKKYVRCKCNCLLICKASSQRISCPRENCKRVILLQVPGAEVSSVTNTRAMRITCAYCRRVFFLATSRFGLARCPHCRKVSAVRRASVRRLIILFFLTGLVVLFAGILFVVFSHSVPSYDGGFYATCAIVLMLSLVLLLRSLYYYSLRVSVVDNRVV